MVIAVLVGCGSEEPRPSSSQSLPSASASSFSAVNTTVTSEDLPGVPVGLADVSGEPWVAVAQGPFVRMPDGSRVDVGPVPLRLAVTEAGVWVSVFGAGEVALVDPVRRAVVRRVDLGAGAEPEGMAVSGSTLLVVDQAGEQVVLLDARSGKSAAPRRSGAARVSSRSVTAPPGSRTMPTEL